MAELTPRQRAHLKGLAHHLNPVVHIGKDGLSDAVKAQINDALAHHELIKVKLGDNAPLDREAAMTALPAAVDADLVQNLGRLFVLYRAHPDEPKIVLPQPAVPEE
jgi:RNA-binding protein